MVNRIESADNARLRLVRKLQHSRKHRDDESKFVIEGSNLVEEAISRKADIDFILCADDFSELSFIEDSVYDVSEVPRRLFDRISDAENGIGVVAVVSRNRDSIEDIRKLITDDDNILVFDRLQDPGNIGTMIRTAAAAGYKAVIAIKGTVDVYSPKVLRATAGMIFDIPIAYVEDTETFLKIAKDLGKRVAVTVPAGGRPYYETDISKGIALVIGNEGNGISKELIDRADELVTIPMNSGIESLNASVSAAILMYETIRKKKRV